MKRIARLIPVLGLLAVVTASSLAGASTAAQAAPTGLHGFMLTAGESSTSTFHRNPSFAWQPVRGALSYQLQVSTGSTFRQSGMLVDMSNLQTPLGAPTATIPWITGSPHALYARVRAYFGHGRVSPWSADYGFDVVPPHAPTALSAPSGLLRWSLVDGADAYEVWLLDKPQYYIEVTRTTAVDERDFYDGTWPATVRWRVRALRTSVFTPKNFMPAATYGPWSPVYTSTNTAPTSGPITLSKTMSDTVSDGSPDSPAHENMPGFTWSGSQTLDGGTAPYFRVYAYTDAQCVNPVFVGSAVPSPAYAPRVPGADLPANDSNVNADPGDVSKNAGVDGTSLVPNEQRSHTHNPNLGPLVITNDDNQPFIGPPSDLWDVNWPSGGYYWTVVGVMYDESKGTFVDTELPQDACAAGRVQRFGVSSQPATTGNQGAFASGLSAQGRLVSAARTAKFYGQPLVAWTPAISASIYQLQWSRSRYPFSPRGSRWTFTTSAVLPLKPGTWYYRVRGYDYDLPTSQIAPSDAPAMAWSQPVKIVITAPRLRIIGAPRR